MMKIYRIKLNELSRSCCELKKYIDKEKPDWIIPIYSGGLEICKILWGNDSPDNIICGTYIQHKPNPLKDFLIRFLPKFIIDLMIKIEYHIKPKSEKRLIIAGDFSYLRGKVLILDDAIDTGVTIRALKSRFPSIVDDIKVAVINDIPGNSEVDFSIYSKMLVRFPWNQDYN